MTEDALFPADTTPPPEGRATNPVTIRRNTKNQQAIDKGFHPLNGLRLADNGHHCGDCANRVLRNAGTAKSWPKCDLGPITSGSGTDVRSGWPACNRWEPKP